MPPVVQLNEDGDPPLLEGVNQIHIDIGINIEKVRSRLLLVIKLQQPVPDMVSDPDLVGPFAIALALGFLLLFAGKIHFGDIYAMFIVGNILSYLLINLMSKVSLVVARLTSFRCTM